MTPYKITTPSVNNPRIETNVISIAIKAYFEYFELISESDSTEFETSSSSQSIIKVQEDGVPRHLYSSSILQLEQPSPS